MLKISEIKDFTDVVEFKDDYNYVYKKDNRARASLNKTLEAEFVAVYRRDTKYDECQWKADSIILDEELFYIITKRGKVLFHNNSEWGSIEVIK